MQVKPPSTRFAVTSHGLTATRWLSFVLASHPKVFVAHGKHQLDSIASGRFNEEQSGAHQASLEKGNDLLEFYESHTLEEVYSQYEQVRKDTEAIGSVHTYTIESLLRALEFPGTFASLRVRNVLRHPVGYIASHESLVRSAELHPRLYQLYTDRVFPQALAAFPELFLMPCPDLKEFFTFVVSCFGVANQLVDLAYYPGLQHFRMEDLTTSIDHLRSLCEGVTGLSYSPSVLEGFIQQGAINSHRRAGKKIDPRTQYDSWPAWKKDIARVMIPGTVLAGFETHGYDVFMFHEVYAATKTGTIRCLGDHLRAVAPDHPWLQNLDKPSPSPIQELESKYQGFHLVDRDGRTHAVAGIADPERFASLSPEQVKALEDEGLCLSAEPREELMMAIHKCLSTVQSQFEQEPRQLEEGFRGFNLVAYRGKVYALSQELGGINLSTLGIEELQLLEGRGEVFVCSSLSETKKRLRQLSFEPAPRLLEEGYRGFNLVAYRNNVYAISQSLGPFDLTRVGSDEVVRAEKLKKLFVSPSVKEARRNIEIAVPGSNTLGQTIKRSRNS